MLADSNWGLNWIWINHRKRPTTFNHSKVAWKNITQVFIGEKNCTDGFNKLQKTTPLSLLHGESYSFFISSNKSTIPPFNPSSRSAPKNLGAWGLWNPFQMRRCLLVCDSGKDVWMLWMACDGLHHCRWCCLIRGSLFPTYFGATGLQKGRR